MTGLVVQSTGSQNTAVHHRYRIMYASQMSINIKTRVRRTSRYTKSATGNVIHIMSSIPSNPSDIERSSSPIIWARESGNEPSGEHNFFLEIAGNNTYRPKNCNLTRTEIRRKLPLRSASAFCGTYSLGMLKETWPC